jgi:hypothetical protein
MAGQNNGSVIKQLFYTSSLSFSLPLSLSLSLSLFLFLAKSIIARPIKQCATIYIRIELKSSVPSKRGFLASLQFLIT